MNYNINSVHVNVNAIFAKSPLLCGDPTSVVILCSAYDMSENVQMKHKQVHTLACRRS